MDNKFDCAEDLQILIISLAGTYGILTLDLSSLGIKIVLAALITVDLITATNVVRGLMSYIKDKKKNKNKSKTEEIVKEKELVNEITKENEKVKTIDYSIKNVNEEEKAKQLVLKK